MNVKFVDLKRMHYPFVDEFSVYLRRHIKDSDFILGKDVELFEEEFARFCGAKYCVGTSSGTDAVKLALLACGVKKGDEVVVPTFTFIGRILGAVYLGARPVFCDVEDDTLGIDIQDLKSKITFKTRAIVPVHLYGNPCNIEEILKIARKRGIKVIEDACQAHGARLSSSGKMAGSVGDCGCFSFYPSKNLGALGDAGAIITNRKDIYRRLKKLRDYGRSSKYVSHRLGFNNRLDTIQASFLRLKLKYLDRDNQRRRKIASWYRGLLEGLEEVKVLPQEKYGDCIYHILAIICPYREKLSLFLRKKGIETGIHYPVPLHLQPCFKKLGFKKDKFPVSERLSKSVLSLPMHPYLRKGEVEFVCRNIREFYSKALYRKSF